MCSKPPNKQRQDSNEKKAGHSLFTLPAKTKLYQLIRRSLSGSLERTFLRDIALNHVAVISPACESVPVFVATRCNV